MDKTLDYDVVIVGAGISGSVIAEQFANQLKFKVLIIDQRNHLGGNCYDHINEIGLRVSDYGPHCFHTNDEKVWSYIKSFADWTPFEPCCLSHVAGKKVPLPINLDTINQLFKTNLTTEEEMKTWLASETTNFDSCANSEEAALKRVGKTLYELMFKNYTIKQWDKEPKEMDASVMDRIPIRYNHDKRYFTDKYQMYPTGGYTALFEKMLDHPLIEIRLNTSWEQIKERIKFKYLFYTGTIDSFFNFKFGRLEYRSLKFESETIKQEFYQDTFQENYPELDVPYTRCIEYKYQTGQQNRYTTIVREYPTWNGEPYYPVLTKVNQEKYQQYEQEANHLKQQHIYFLGRLANYKYFNMDQTFANALNCFATVAAQLASKEQGPRTGSRGQ